MSSIQNTLRSSLFFGVLFLFVTTSCGLFDKESTIDTSQLVGEWTITDADVVPEIGGLPIKNYFTDILGMSGLEAEAFAALYNTFLKESLTGTVDFRDNNTYVFSVAEEVEDGTWALNSDGNKIILNGGTSGEQLITILELTSSTLKVSYDELSMEDLDDNPDTPEVEVSLKVEMTLTK